MDNRTYLGIRIHDARKACNLTQQELSDETGVSIKMIQCIEGGKVNRFLGKFRACSRANQMVLLNTLDFLAEQLLALQEDKGEN